MGERDDRLELTPEQRKKIKDATGKDVVALEFEQLEDREAPTVFGLKKQLRPAHD